MRIDRLGLVTAILVFPLAVLAAAEPGVLTRAPEDLVWSVSTLFGGFLGISLHVCFSWGEWRKLTAKSIGLVQYVHEDLPGFMVAWILATIAYFGLPVLGSIPAVQSFMGFAPGMNFLSAAAATYIASSLGYKVRSFFLKKAQ